MLHILLMLNFSLYLYVWIHFLLLAIREWLGMGNFLMARKKCVLLTVFMFTMICNFLQTIPKFLVGGLCQGVVVSCLCQKCLLNLWSQSQKCDLCITKYSSFSHIAMLGEILRRAIMWCRKRFSCMLVGILHIAPAN